jgi:hypothetical protein
VQPIVVKFVGGRVELDGVPLEGTVDVQAYLEIASAARALKAALSIDPEAPVAELGKQLASDDPFTRERVLALLQERGREAVEVLPAIANLLRPPLRRQVVFGVDRTAAGQRAAARAIVAVAAPEDPLVAEAKALLAEQPRK